MFFDDQLKGFGVRVMPNRPDGRPRKVFLVQYRADGRVRRETLGDWGTELSATQARRRAEALRGKVRDGRDPVAERRAAATARRAAEAEAQLAAAVEAFTFEKLIAAWEKRALVNRRQSYRDEATSKLRRSLPGWLNRPAAGITRPEAASMLQEIADTRGPVAGNRVMAYARACYGWAIKASLLEANPFANLAPPGRERPRDRVLSPAELQAIWTATEALGPIQQAFVRFLMLTLQRREEVAGATWSEISADGETWTIPAERAKNGRTHLVHLAPAARAVIETLPRGRAGDLIFALPTNGPKQVKLSSFSAIKRELVRAMPGGADWPRWTFHDFRRAGVTALADAGFPPHVCDRLLNHVTGAIQGVAAVYQRAEFLAERRAALEAWATCVSIRPQSGSHDAQMFDEPEKLSQH